MGSGLREGWEVLELGELGKVSMCKRILKKQTTTTGDIPFYKIGTFGKTSNAFISKDLYDEYRNKYSFPKKGDILISASGTIGRRVIYDGKPAYFQDSNIVWINNNEELILNEYLYLFYGYCDWNPSKGATISRLYNSNLRAIKISFPKSLQEQKKIVAILDEAFLAIDKAKVNAELNLQNAKELFESYLQGVFENRDEGWDEKSLGEMADFRNGINFTKNSKGKEIKIVGVKNFQKHFFIPLENLASVTMDGDLNENDILKNNDILAVRSNGNPKLIGRTILAKNITQTMSHSGFTIRIRLNSSNISSIYLCHYLKTQKTRDELVKSGNGIGIRSLNQGSLSSLIIPFPPLKIQQKIVKKLNAIQEQTKKLESIYTQKLQDLEGLKKSILQKAFSGELL